jgi:hydroxymethylglutaryl-CoA lyase
VLAPNRKGFELARDAGAHRVGLFMSVTESHNKANVNRACEESFADLAGIVRDARAAGMAVRFNLSCPFHCPFEGVVPEATALAWAERAAALDPTIEIAICDTTGNAAPDQVRRVFAAAVTAWPGPDGAPRLAFHGHDTYGLGVANAAAAWEAGCRVIDSAAGGLGGCPFAPGATGNVATEDVAWLFRRMGVPTGVDWAALLAAADFAAQIPGAQPGGRMRAVPAARRAA